MKKISVIALVAVGLLAVSCNNKEKTTDTAVATEQSVAEGKGEALAVDTVTSVVNWKAFHKGGFAPRWGTLNIKSGDLNIEGGQLVAGSFTIDMTSIKVDPASVTEKDKKPADLETHLKSADFFAVDKNPVSDFKITSVADVKDAPKDAVAGANKTISGNLTLLGKTMNVSFPAKVNVTDASADIQAKFTVNRADWGIKFGTSEADPAEWMISKDIEIAIDVKAKK
ncbi:YceI family protein [Chryseobacterium indologenes]|uniref:YceI family protein n=1 Tax=Chryseobacterium indologenes TaxID=253 RepID=A0A4U8VIC9_CHRID|nr:MULTISPECIES: YceI family protein [Chryseobacterium]ASE61507.1 YceI family protein [Chryseobacterium indologenes]AZB17177.1 YceI family protein [Chryseobacterium indologenes]QPQ51668.1 YceI family protein [Chryseobacterium indologenes]TLX23688.1 YceI family protein [Chryseobacterium indologenes]SFI77716.1 Polyisoprenoid-binding protein YceI [Chryseobacterium indologenes]